jgi:hypothetical protein
MPHLRHEDEHMKSTKSLAALLLCLVWSLGLAQGGDHAAELKRLKEEWQKEYSAFLKPFEAMKTDAERQTFDWSKDPSLAFRPKAKALAQKAVGTPAGEEALLWVWQLSVMGEPDPESAKFAVDHLIQHYPQSGHFTRIVGQLAYSYPYEPAEARAVLRKIIGGTKTESVKAAAKLALARNLSSGNEDEVKESRALFVEVISENRDTPLAQQAEGSLFELDNLQVGKVAPDFETMDENGKPWKLSDYRGQVVVLTFWGMW